MTESFDDALRAIELTVAPYATCRRYGCGPYELELHAADGAQIIAARAPTAQRLRDRLADGLGPEQVERFPGGGGKGANSPALTLPCNTDSPGGLATLRLANIVGGTTTTVYDRTLPIGTSSQHPEVPTWTLGHAELKTAGLTLDRPWLAPTNPLVAEFRTTGFSKDLPVELQIYAREPEELGLFADTLETDPAAIRAQVANWWHSAWAPGNPLNPFTAYATLPDALSILSPTGPFSWSSLTSPEDATVRLSSSDFFGRRYPAWTGDPATDISGAPSGASSVKSARITFPGLCTLEILYGRPTPPASGTFSEAGFASIFALLEPILYQHLSDVCQRLSPFSVDSIIAFPLIRSDSLSSRGGLTTDSRAQLFLSIRLAGADGARTSARGVSSIENDRTCVTQASVIYDLRLDARGALVVELAGKPLYAANSPHSPHTVDVETDTTLHTEAHSIDWQWIADNGHVRSGVAAIRIVDNSGTFHGWYCNHWNAPPFPAAEGGPSPYPAGLNEVFLLLFTEFIPMELNAALRRIQMFPRWNPTLGPIGAPDTLPTNARWACDPTAAVHDPQHHLYDTRKAFFPKIPLASQMETGFGFIPLSNRNARDNCAAARDDFCDAVRRGYAAYHNLPQPAPCPVAGSGACCVSNTTDSPQLALLVGAVAQKDIFGNFAHWGCAGLDPGNLDCVGGGDDRLLLPNGVNGSLELVPNPAQAGGFSPCPLGKGSCLSRVPGTSPAKWPHAGTWLHSPYGCRPDVTSGNCYFLPPARRLIPNPDGVQLVFYENDGDCSTAALALRYAVHGYQLAEGVTHSYPSFSAFPSLDYQRGADIEQVLYNQPATLQGFWKPAHQVPNEPMAICNYNRFNDLPPPQSVVVPEPKSSSVTGADFYGHPWRSFTFPRQYAVYAPDVSRWFCT